ncbi:MAG: hypothetical protein HY904_00210 [Deltaproteobacteria bacterium]|nr:hypothetical protein [Deltaproteobacteria bacterium]
MDLTGPIRRGTAPTPGTGATTGTQTATLTTPAAPAAAAGTPALPVDGFDRAGRATGPALPPVLLEVGNHKVGHGTDPGDYYCEHMFFTTQKEAQRPGSSVQTNRAGENLVGFLHIPGDAQTYTSGGTYSQAERHGATRDVVGAALRGYVDEASAKLKPREPVRVMLNGYGTFMSTVNNPTGDFVKNRENIDAAMKSAYGANLVTPEGHDAGRSGDGQVWQYVIREPNTRALRTVLVRAQEWPVTDDTIGGGAAGSVQAAMKEFKPSAVLSMGVGTPDYTAEFHADNGGMRTMEGRNSHDDGAAASEQLPDNRSLARAIHAGGMAARASRAAGAPVG